MRRICVALILHAKLTLMLLQKARFGLVVTKSRVVCHICNQEMPYKNITTNMYLHLECHHKDEYMKLCKPGNYPCVIKRGTAVFNCCKFLPILQRKGLVQPNTNSWLMPSGHLIWGLLLLLKERVFVSWWEQLSIDSRLGVFWDLSSMPVMGTGYQEVWS